MPIKGDTIDEPNESFELRFTAAGLGEAVLLDRVSTVTILDDDYCRRSPGYWKTHRSSWAVDHLVVGATEYDDDAMMDFLEYGGPDGATRLARHLVATKLNLAKGSHPWIQPTVTAADLFLERHPPGSAPSGAALTEANASRTYSIRTTTPDVRCLDDRRTIQEAPGANGESARQRSRSLRLRVAVSLTLAAGAAGIGAQSPESPAGQNRRESESSILRALAAGRPERETIDRYLSDLHEPPAGGLPQLLPGCR